jgi:glycosyltransferase involved in cell wall biosynthesis
VDAGGASDRIGSGCGPSLRRSNGWLMLGALMLVSIVIPAHNEAANVEELMCELNEALAKLPDDVRDEVEVIFVDDASTDGTLELLEELGRRYAFVKVIAMSARGGQTGCYQEAFRQAQGRYIIRMDADLQDDPRDLQKYFELLADDPDIVMGLRQVRRSRRILRLSTTVYDILVMLLFDSPFHTNSSSFVLFKSKWVKGLQLRNNDHRYLPLIALSRGAARLREVVIDNRDRKRGESKYGYYTKFLKGIPELFAFLVRLRLKQYSTSKHPLEK